MSGTRSSPERRSFRIFVSILTVSLAALPSGALAAETPPSVHILSSGSTRVEVMDPFAPDRYNSGFRFTPLATVLGVEVDGHSFLYHPAQHGPKEDDGGLASEFDLCAPGAVDDDFPPGYLDASIGGGFLKIGVGVLRKQKEPYSLFQQNEVMDLAKTTATWSNDHAEFRQTCPGIDGYAYDLVSRIKVSRGQVAVRWELTNTGTKKLKTKQYTHDFMRIDDHDVTSGYTLSFPYDFNATGLESGQKQSGRDILFTGAIPTWINAVVPFPPGYRGPNTFILKCPATGASIRGEVSLPGLRTAIHARKAYIAPEQFVALNIAPGEKIAWTRTYHFRP